MKKLLYMLLALLGISATGCMRVEYGTPHVNFNLKARVIDEVVVTRFVGPASYTGEDVVELSCHGGMLVTRRVLERLLQCGIQCGFAVPHD